MGYGIHQQRLRKRYKYEHTLQGVFENTDELSRVAMCFQRSSNLFHHETMVPSYGWFATCPLVEWQELMGTCLLQGSFGKPYILVCERSGDILNVPCPQILENLPFRGRGVVIDVWAPVIFEEDQAFARHIVCNIALSAASGWRAASEVASSDDEFSLPRLYGAFLRI